MQTRTEGERQQPLNQEHEADEVLQRAPETDERAAETMPRATESAER